MRLPLGKNKSIPRTCTQEVNPQAQARGLNPSMHSAQATRRKTTPTGAGK